MKLESVSNEIAKFDLLFRLIERRGPGGEPEGITGVIEYSRDLFDHDTAQKLADRLVRLLEKVSADPEKPIGSPDLLKEEEREQLVVNWNQTRSEYGEPRCVHELIEEQAQRTPQAVAVAYGGQQISYRELDERANRIAHYLKGLGVGVESRVGLCMKRCSEMMIAALGVWKAGGAYVPLDAGAPAERLRGMVEEAGAVAVISHRAVETEKLGEQVRVIKVDEMEEELGQQSCERPEAVVGAGHLAYVLYTSGST